MSLSSWLDSRHLKDGKMSNIWQGGANKEESGAEHLLLARSNDTV